MALYERLAIADIQAAADSFRPTFDRLGGDDGYVSLEVSPYSGHDTEAPSPRRGGCGARSSGRT